MPVFRFIVFFDSQDPRSNHYLKEARALGFHALRRVTVQDLYFIEGQLSQEMCQQLALKLLTDPVAQTANWQEVSSTGKRSTTPDPDTVMVEVALRPGVTDPVAEQIVRAAHELGFEGITRAATGLRFLVEGADRPTVENLTRRLLVNDVIQHWTVGEIAPSFPQETASSSSVETITIRGLNDDQLLTVSKDRRAALDLPEMKAIQGYYQKEA